MNENKEEDHAAVSDDEIDYFEPDQDKVPPIDSGDEAPEDSDLSDKSPPMNN